MIVTHHHKWEPNNTLDRYECREPECSAAMPFNAKEGDEPIDMLEVPVLVGAEDGAAYLNDAGGNPDATSLLAAFQSLGEGGWKQKPFMGEGDPYCLLGVAMSQQPRKPLPKRWRLGHIRDAKFPQFRVTGYLAPKTKGGLRRDGEWSITIKGHTFCVIKGLGWDPEDY